VYHIFVLQMYTKCNLVLISILTTHPLRVYQPAAEWGSRCDTQRHTRHTLSVYSAPSCLRTRYTRRTCSSSLPRPDNESTRVCSRLLKYVHGQTVHTAVLHHFIYIWRNVDSFIQTTFTHWITEYNEWVHAFVVSVEI